MAWIRLKLASYIYLLFLCFILIAGETYQHKKTAHNEVTKIDACSCMIGPAGIPGVPGVPGMHGQRGQDGYKGDKGESGLPGFPGKSGREGQVGPQGPPAEKGSRGRRGHMGVKGRTGEIGNPGVTGPQGPKGMPQRVPTKIAFSTARSKKLGPISQDTPITFDHVFTNIGNHFDPYSSHFVCQINGTYIFFVHVLGQHKKDAFAWIMKNNNHLVPLHGDARAGYGTGSNSVILRLHKDDHIWIQLSKKSALMNDYSTFSGYLLFED